MEASAADIATLLVVNAAIVFAAVLLLWAISIPLRDVSIIDMFFAVILLGVAVASYLLTDGSESRKQLIVFLVAVWALRITVHLIRRNWGHGEDPRYTKLRGWVSDERSFVWLSLRKVFLLQGIVLWFVSLPVQVGQLYSVPSQPGWLAFVGVAVWAIGMFFETVADIQLTRFRADPANEGTVLNTGLWKYSRHPNYFGELCIWWGLFIIACEHPAGVLTVVGPLLYTHLIVNVTGQATLDKKLAKSRAGYREYMQTTSGLIPMPPRSDSASP